ncbi:MAG: biopolymer transporter ExbD [Kiritimatiellia bacterium]|jgi:biopolymer transport protein ExbD|nr:biopolymer transporter ExbD [Kiritimatiellia bacterium]MDP6810258.1 biopolymer transporter ExbD [Kiritimatiellia bacterium]MDP7022753.1 biopolymer transporter ExbD [Kiritimatiellia bacterium]
MAFKARKSKKDVPIPLDSFSDIAFLLIIFFILTTSIEKLVGFSTELPTGKATAQKQETAKTPTVVLKAGGALFNDQSVTLDQLTHRLGALELGEKEDAERVVLLDAGKDVDYQLYFEVMSLITDANGVIGILTEE